MTTKTLGPWKLTVPEKRGTAGWGRFGGGWQWKLGIQVGNVTRKDGFEAIVSLLTRDYRVSYRPKTSRYRKDSK